LSPVTHFLSGWVLANVTPFDRRDRAIVALACVVPDVDGLGAIPEVLTNNHCEQCTIACRIEIAADDYVHQQ
jgi:hypothetical protein